MKRSTSRAPRPRTTRAAKAAATPDGLTALLDAFSRFASRHQLAERTRHEIYIALDEVLSNKVKHRRPRGGRMTLELSLSEGVLHATVRDNGPEFDPLTVPRPSTDTPLLERPIGGLGLLFVSELMDDVRYERQGAWNCLKMTKRLS